MAPTGFVAFLLFLGLVVSNVYGDNAECQKILPATVNNANLKDITLTVSPDKLLSNTNYKVDLDGAGLFTVILQANAQSKSVGSWSQVTTDNSCNGGPLFLSNNHIQTTWTSPEKETSVTINAYIHNGTDTFLLHQTLSQDSNPTSKTISEATTTKNKESPKPSGDAATTTKNKESPKPGDVTTHPVHKTTNAGCVEQSSLVPMALSVILSLLLIPNKYLS